MTIANFDIKLRLIQVILAYAPTSLTQAIEMYNATRTARLEPTDELTYAQGLTALNTLLAGDPTTAARLLTA